MSKKIKIILALLVIVIGSFALFYSSKISNFLQGNIFGTQGEEETTDQDIYIPTNYKGLQGDEGAIEIKSNLNLEDVIGFSFELEWDSEQLFALGIDSSNTIIDGEGFLTEANVDNLGSMTGIVATGGDGVSVGQGDVLMKVSLQIADSIPLGTAIPISIKNFSVVQDINGTLTETVLTTDSGKITVQQEGDFKIIDVNTLSSSSVEITFSDYVSSASLDDFTFSPELKNSNSTLEVDSHKVIIKNLDQQVPYQRYKITAGGTLAGNSSGNIATDFSFAYFTGYPEREYLSDFYIKKVVPVSENTFDVSFSKEINSLSIDKDDFNIEGLEITNIAVIPNDNTTLRVKTAPQSPLIEEKSCTASVAVSNEADLTLDVSANRTVINPSDTVFYTVNYENQGKSEALNSYIELTLPNATQLGNSSNCAYDSGKSKNLCQLGTIAAGSAGSVSFSVVGNYTGERVLTATIYTSSNEYSTANNSYQEKILATGEYFADLTTKTTYQNSGETIRVDFANKGNNYAEDTVLNTNLSPISILDVADYTCRSEGSACTCEIDEQNNSLSCSLGNLSAGGSGYLEINTTKKYQGIADFYSDIETNTTESKINNNSSDVKIAVVKNESNQLEFFKKAEKTIIEVGDSSVITLKIKNKTSSDISNLVIYDPINSNFSIDESSLPSECTYSYSNSRVECNVTNIAFNEERLVSYSVVADSDGETETQASFGLDANNLSKSNTLKLKVGSDQKTDLAIYGQAEVKGDLVVVKLNYTNTGTTDAGTVSIVSKFDQSGIIEIKDKNSCTINSDRSKISCTIDSLAAGESGTLTYEAEVINKGSLNITNTISASNDYNQSNNTWSNNVIISKAGYIKMTGLANPSVLATGESTEITINYQNLGEIVARDVVITSTLSPASAFDSYKIVAENEASCTATSSGVSCFVGDLNVGESGTIKFSATAKQNTSASVITESSDQNTLTNKIAVSSSAQPDLVIKKSVDNYFAEAGDTVKNTINFYNTGNTEAKNIVIRDGLLPLNNITLAKNDYNCEVKTGYIECKIATMTAGSSGSFSYTGVVSDDATGITFKNTYIESDSTESNLENNFDRTGINTKNQECYLEVYPEIIGSGETALISWESVGYSGKISPLNSNISLPNGSLAISPSQSTNYTLTAKPKGDYLLSIKNDDASNDLLSADGEILSMNVSAFNPYGAENITGSAPQIDSVQTESNGDITIKFVNNILASSATEGYCESLSGETEGICNIYSVKAIDSSGDIDNTELVSTDTEVEISSDYKTITLKNIDTKAGEMYLLKITPNTIKDYETEKAIGNFYNQTVFIGANTSHELSNFGINNLEVLDANNIKVTFNATPADESINPIYFKIYTSESGTDKTLTVANVSKNGNTVLLSTYAQEEGQLYFLIVDPENFYDQDDNLIGAKNNQGFTSYTQNTIGITSVSPNNFDNKDDTKITITGENFPSNASVKLGQTSLDIVSITSTAIIATVPADFTAGIYDLYITADGFSDVSKSNAVVITKSETQINIIEDQSYASPYKVSNRNGTTRLWVLVEDPLGVSDIEKVIADLRPIDGDAAVTFSSEDNSVAITNNEKWFYLDITIPSTVSTSTDPMEITVTAENKSGLITEGAVDFLVTRDTTSSIAPSFKSAYVYPATASPGDTISFYVEVSDEDGADDISQVILQLGAIGLNTRVMQTVDNMYETLDSLRACTQSDYIVGDWSDCGTNGIKTRSVELKSGVECEEDLSTAPVDEQACTVKQCTTSDWQPDDWSPCVDGYQTRSYELKSGVSCQGTTSKPSDDMRTCDSSDDTSFIEWLIPSAYASEATEENNSSLIDWFVPSASAASLAGESVWLEEIDLKLPDNLAVGNYQIPITVYDAEGESTSTTISFVVAKNNSSDIPNIDEEDIYGSPKDSVVNDGETTVNIFVKATDPQGGDTLKSMTADLMEIGHAPISMTKTAVDGDGAWFSTGDLTVASTISPGHRELSFTVTDEDGNYFTYDDYEFYVSDKTQEGDAPTVVSEKNYTSPSTAISDGTTRMSFYVYVEEGDADIESVVANLGNIASYVGTEDLSTYQGYNKTSSSEDKTTGSNSATTSSSSTSSSSIKTSLSTKIVPLKPSVKEGTIGRWYILSDIVIDEDVQPSSEPYIIPITASDAFGNTDEGELKIYVTDGLLADAETNMPYLKSATAIDNRTVEALFSQGLNTKNISTSAFKIVEYEDSETILPIKDLDYSADGRIVRFNTNFMNENAVYTLIADADKLDLAQSQKYSNQVNFDSYSSGTYSDTPVLKDVKAISKNVVQLLFNQPLKYSSINEDGSNFSIFEKDSSGKLEIKSVRFGSDSKTLLITTADQVPNANYYLTLTGAENAIGKKVNTRTKLFTGYISSTSSTALLAQADFNQDGKIDFLDFTIFATVYGRTVSDGEQSMDLNGDGTVDFTDFTLFAANFGLSTSDTDNSFSTYDVKDNISTSVFPSS